MNTILKKLDDMNFVQTTPESYDGKKPNTFVDNEPSQWAIPSGRPTDSFQDLLNGIADLDTEHEYREYAKRIENSGLPKKQQDLLLLNMRSPKN